MPLPKMIIVINFWVSYGWWHLLACFYVYKQKKKRAHNYTIDVDKLRKYLMELYVQNQEIQNVLAYIPFW